MCSGTRKEMVCIVAQYFSLHKSLLLVIGLWPYQQSKLARLQFILFASILTTSILFQLTTFLTSKCTSNFIIKVLSTSIFFSSFMIAYISSGINVEKLKDLLTQLQHVYNKLKDKNEYAIIEKYSYIAKYYTVGLTTISIFGVSTLIVTQYWPYIYDVIFPTNESQSRNMIIITEYFIDQERYFSLILLHISAAGAIGAAGLVAMGTMLIAYMQCVCGMFKIASYRIERAVGIVMLKNNNVKDESFIFKGIICAIDIHREAMKLSKHLQYKFEIVIFFIMIFTVISLSLNLFRMATENNLMERLLSFVFVTVNIICMFLANNIGQVVADHNNHVFVTAYHVRWYSTSLHIQRLILFLLQRAVKDFSLNIGGLFIASLQCFAALVNTSVSYFTVIYSTRS